VRDLFILRIENKDITDQYLTNSNFEALYFFGEV